MECLWDVNSLITVTHQTSSQGMDYNTAMSDWTLIQNYRNWLLSKLGMSLLPSKLGNKLLIASTESSIASA